MSEILLRPGQWQITNACVAYSFLASLAILLGYSQKHNDFLLKVCDNLFEKRPSKGSFEFQMLESLGKLPLSYAVNEMNKFSDVQRKQLRIWYEEVLLLEPQMKSNPFLDMMLLSINPIINKF